MSAGKGDTPRKVDGVKFRANYVNIFKKHETTTEHPDTDDSRKAHGQPDDPAKQDCRANSRTAR